MQIMHSIGNAPFQHHLRNMLHIVSQSKGIALLRNTQKSYKEVKKECICHFLAALLMHFIILLELFGDNLFTKSHCKVSFILLVHK